MKKIFRKENTLVESRFFIVSIFILAVGSLFFLRLWFLQIYKGDEYKRISERNRVRKIEVPAPRGRLFDRYGALILGNTASADLILIPQYVQDFDKTSQILSELLHTPLTYVKKRIASTRGQPQFFPVTLIRNLSQHELSVIENNSVFLPGIDILTTPRREYQTGVSAHMIGYLGEISPQNLEDLNRTHKNNPYALGEWIGKHGLEKRWEEDLRGKKGTKYIQVDASGREISRNFQLSKLTLPNSEAVPGNDLVLTLDFELQKTVHQAFAGKSGSVVVMDPRNGEILGLVSSPEFNLENYQKGLSREEWTALTTDPMNPLLDKSTGGEYPPGSVYKAVLAIAGLEEKVIDANRTFHCPGYYTLGNQTFRCYHRQGHGTVNLERALMKSCDVFFYHLGTELGVDRIAKYARAFGLGQKLGFDLNMERPGLVPSSAWKLATLKQPWALGDTPPIAIGQGYNLMTPLQMASLFMGIANKGEIWKPYMVKKVVSHRGEVRLEIKPQLLRKVGIVTLETFDRVRAGLEAVVMSPEGTGKNARVPGISVAGKTGSVQVVNLKKNNKQKDVSIKWREHAMFASFAPTENPEIVVVVVSEHDEVSGGGASAAPIAGVILKKYFELKSKRSLQTAGVNP